MSFPLALVAKHLQETFREQFCDLEVIQFDPWALPRSMLLNEFLKEHRKVTKLESTVAEQQKQIDALTAGLQKVSAQLEVSKRAPKTVSINH